ncbi:MAG: YARHG domain-containing protein [Desulfobacteraceae bacterium]|nr:MAG: YARHG domain-containing protein [Desulfobacteraceae bacterium]
MTIKIIYPIKIPFHYLDIYPSGCKYEANQLAWNFKDYNVSMGTQISANIILVVEEPDILPKHFFTGRMVENVEYKLDKQYFHYYIDANREDDPNNSTKAIKSPEYALNEVAFIRNEIYARKGYVFKDPKYQNYFLKKTWYKPNPKFSFSEMNYIEKRNASYLKCVEEVIANFPQEFKTYFKGSHLYEGKLVYYCWDGDGCDFLDEEYFSLEDKYMSSVESCYGQYLP